MDAILIGSTQKEISFYSMELTPSEMFLELQPKPNHTLELTLQGKKQETHKNLQGGISFLPSALCMAAELGPAVWCQPSSAQLHSQEPVRTFPCIPSLHHFCPPGSPYLFTSPCFPPSFPPTNQPTYLLTAPSCVYYLLTAFVFRSSPEWGPKAVDIIVLSSILYAQPCELSYTEDM